MVIQAFLFEKIDGAARGAGFGIGRAKDHAPDPGVEHGADAHRAGLERDIQGGAEQAIVLHFARRGAHGLHLGVRGRVGGADRPVPAFADDLLVEHDYGADRHLALALRALRELQRPTHEGFIIHWMLLYSSGLKPTTSRPRNSNTGRLIIEGCASISAMAFFSSRFSLLEPGLMVWQLRMPYILIAITRRPCLLPRPLHRRARSRS